MFSYGTLGGALIFGVLQIIGIIIACIFAYALIVAIRWKLFTKAGEAGWKALIPGYNVYLTFKLCWTTKWFWVMLGSIVAVMIGMLIPLLGPVIYVAGLLVLIFISTFFCMQMAKAFGKEESYGLGLMLIGPVFEFMLAFDRNVKYVGPQADPQFFSSVTSDLKAEVNSLKKEKPAQEMKFDPYTGEPINRKESVQFDNVVPDTKYNNNNTEKSTSVESLVNQFEKTEDEEVEVIEPGNLR